MLPVTIGGLAVISFYTCRNIVTLHTLTLHIHTFPLLKHIQQMYIHISLFLFKVETLFYKYTYFAFSVKRSVNVSKL